MTYLYAFTRNVDGQDIYFANDVNELQIAIEEISENRVNFNEREMEVLTNMGVNTLTTVGFTAAPTVTGTPTNVDDADGPLNNYQSGAVSGNVGGLNSAAAVCRRDWLPKFICRAKMPASLATARNWIGLFSGSPMASATPAVHLAGFRYDTVADGTAFWRCVTDDASGTPTVTVTTVAVAINTAYVFRMVLSATDVKFYINGTLVATHTTHLPTATTALFWYAAVATLAASAQNIKFSRCAVKHV
jgi:hypothetical protein